MKASTRLKLIALALACAPASALAQTSADCPSVTPLTPSRAKAHADAQRGGFQGTSWKLPAAGGSTGCAEAPTADGAQILVYPTERFSIGQTPMIALYAGSVAFVAPAATGVPAISQPAAAEAYACERRAVQGGVLTLCGTRHDLAGKAEVKAGVMSGGATAMLSLDGALFGDVAKLDQSRPPQLVKNGQAVEGVWQKKMLYAIAYGGVAVFEGPTFGQFLMALKPDEALAVRVWRTGETQPFDTGLSAEAMLNQIQSSLAVAQAMAPK